MFNHQITVRNYLNPLASNFAKQMTESNDQPTGGTAAFRAIKQASNLMLESNKLNGEKRYPNAVLRIIVISDGEDNNSTSQERAEITNFLIENQISKLNYCINRRNCQRTCISFTSNWRSSPLYKQIQ